MDSDKIERAIEFILKLQADAAARMDKTDADMKETDKRIKEFTASTKSFHEDMKGYIKILTPLLEVQSRRLDRLEGIR